MGTTEEDLLAMAWGGFPGKKVDVTKTSPTDPFYMVSISTGSAPAHRYDTLEKAKAEAQALAKRLNKRVYILQPITTCAPVGEVEWMDMAEGKEEKQ